MLGGYARRRVWPGSSLGRVFCAALPCPYVARLCREGSLCPLCALALRRYLDSTSSSTEGELCLPPTPAPALPTLHMRTHSPLVCLLHRYAWPWERLNGLTIILDQAHFEAHFCQVRAQLPLAASPATPVPLTSPEHNLLQFPHARIATDLCVCQSVCRYVGRREASGGPGWASRAGPRGPIFKAILLPPPHHML